MSRHLLLVFILLNEILSEGENVVSLFVGFLFV